MGIFRQALAFETSEAVRTTMLLVRATHSIPLRTAAVFVLTNTTAGTAIRTLLLAPWTKDGFDMGRDICIRTAR